MDLPTEVFLRRVKLPLQVVQSGARLEAGLFAGLLTQGVECFELDNWIAAYFLKHWSSRRRTARLKCFLRFRRALDRARDLTQKHETGQLWTG